MNIECDLAIVGAGLSALSFLHAGGARDCRAVVIEYASQAGGSLRTALPHENFLHEVRLVDTFHPPANVQMLFNATATKFESAERELSIQTRQGVGTILAKRVLLACGALEETRERAQIPGSRPAGVCTPSFIHQILDRGYVPGRNAIVYGSSMIALATATRMASAGVTVTLVPPVGTGKCTAGSNVRVEEPARLVMVRGSERVENVRFSRGEEVLELAADTLVFAIACFANTPWLATSGLKLTASGAIDVDDSLQTNVPGVFATGAVVGPTPDHLDSLALGEKAAHTVLRI